jgi:hypothetical protein
MATMENYNGIFLLLSKSNYKNLDLETHYNIAIAKLSSLLILHLRNG